MEDNAMEKFKEEEKRYRTKFMPNEKQIRQIRNSEDSQDISYIHASSFLITCRFRQTRLRVNSIVTSWQCR